MRSQPLPGKVALGVVPANARLHASSAAVRGLAGVLCADQHAAEVSLHHLLAKQSMDVSVTNIN